SALGSNAARSLAFLAGQSGEALAAFEPGKQVFGLAAGIGRVGMVTLLDDQLAPGDLGGTVILLVMEMIVVIPEHLGKLDLAALGELLIEIHLGQELLPVALAQELQGKARIGELLL